MVAVTEPPQAVATIAGSLKAAVTVTEPPKAVPAATEPPQMVATTAESLKVAVTVTEPLKGVMAITEPPKAVATAAGSPKAVVTTTESPKVAVTVPELSAYYDTAIEAISELSACLVTTTKVISGLCLSCHKTQRLSLNFPPVLLWPRRPSLRS